MGLYSRNYHRPAIVMLVVLLIVFSNPREGGQVSLLDIETGASKRITSDVGDEYDIDGMSYHVLYIEFEAHIGIYGEFNVTVGDTITFFLLDDDQYALFQNRQPHTAYLSQEKVTTGSILFKPSKTAIWHIIFNNRYSDDDKHIHLELYLDQTPPSILCNITQGETYHQPQIARVVVEELRFSLYVITVIDDLEINEHTTDSNIVIIDVELSTLDAGVHTLIINTTDTVGNWGVLTIQFTIAPETSPQTSSSTPNQPFESPDILFMLMIIGAFIGLPAICIIAFRSLYNRFSSGGNAASRKELVRRKKKNR